MRRREIGEEARCERLDMPREETPFGARFGVEASADFTVPSDDADMVDVPDTVSVNVVV